MIEHVSPKIRREEWQIWQTQTTRYTRDESRGEKEDIPWLPRMCPNRRYSQTLLQKRRYSQTLPQKREDIPWLPKLCLNRRSQGPQKKIFPDYLGCAPIEDIPKLKEDIPWLPRPCPVQILFLSNCTCPGLRSYIHSSPGFQTRFYNIDVI